MMLVSKFVERDIVRQTFATKVKVNHLLSGFESSREFLISRVGHGQISLERSTKFIGRELACMTTLVIIMMVMMMIQVVMMMLMMLEMVVIRKEKVNHVHWQINACMISL